MWITDDFTGCGRNKSLKLFSEYGDMSNYWYSFMKCVIPLIVFHLQTAGNQRAVVQGWKFKVVEG